MNKHLKRVLRYIFSFSAVRLGLLITLLFIYFTFDFFMPANEYNWLNIQLRQIHQASVDLRLKLRGQQNPSPDVAIVAVDDESVETLGRWPWPRGRIAEIIDTLIRYDARVVGFDAIFSEPDNNQAVISLNRLLNQSFAKGDIRSVLEKELTQANTDQVLAQTVKRTTNRVVMGMFFSDSDNSHEAYQEYCLSFVAKETYPHKRLEQEEKIFLSVSPTPEIPELFGQIVQGRLQEIEKVEEKQAYCQRWLTEKDEMIEKVKEVWPQVSEGLQGEWAGLSFDDAINRFKSIFAENPVKRVGEWTMNYSSITDHSKNNGYFNATLDSDGSIRRTTLLTRYGDLFIPSLAVKMAMVGENLTGLAKLEDDPTHFGSMRMAELTLNNADSGDAVHTIPTDLYGRMLINYAGPSFSFAHIPVHELINGKDIMNIRIRRGQEVKTEQVQKAIFLKNKYLVFGATAVGIYDLRVTPFEENYPGVETHANAVDNILRDEYLRDLPSQDQKLLLVLLLLGLILSFALGHLGAVSGLLVTGGTLAGIYLFDRHYLFNQGLVTVVIFPVFMIVTQYIFVTFYKYLTEERKKKAIKGTFEKYVSPAIVNEVLKHPENIELGGKKLRMTVMFSDVRGFTTISEKLDPQTLVKVLNTYLTPMTALVFKNKGTLDKYMGDAIMSFYGAPIHYPTHAKEACNCALEMMELLPEINKGFQEKGLPSIDIGIGLNTGEMSVGNMGSETVRSYTVMGDSVNLGSRLEGINKQYGTKIIISEFTYEEVKNDFHCREMDWVRVKGKLQPVRIFELMGRKQNPRFQYQDLIATFSEGFNLYHQRQWTKALDIFNRSLNLKPDDAASQLYIERVQHYITEEPPQDWDGVFDMKTK